MSEEVEKPWWEEDSGELQGQPSVIVDNAPQQIFVNQGMGMPDFPTTAAGVALGISIFGLVCCGPVAIARSRQGEGGASHLDHRHRLVRRANGAGSLRLIQTSITDAECNGRRRAAPRMI